MSNYDVMVDCTHDAVGNVPANGPFTHVGGYVSGTPDIQWTGSDWAKFTRQIRVRYQQGYGGFNVDPNSYNVLDCEPSAWTPEAVAEQVKQRIALGYEETTVYASVSNLPTVASAIVAECGEGALSKVGCIYADWNLNELEAAALLGTLFHGMVVRGVQWASPVSNPETLLPGTGMTLKEANVDLNVVQPGWVPQNAPTGAPQPTPTPVPVPVPTPEPEPVPEPVTGSGTTGWVVFAVNGAGGQPEIASVAVHSTDGGHTWSVTS